MDGSWDYLGAQVFVAAAALLLSVPIWAARALAWRALGLGAVRPRRAATFGALVDAAAACAASAAVYHVLGHSRFAAIGLAFYVLAVWWPLSVWLALVRAARLRAGALRPSLPVLALATLSPAVACYAVFVETEWLVFERRTLRFGELRGHRPLRLAHVSDIQLIRFGARERRLVEQVNAFGPDVVVVTGDYTATMVASEEELPRDRHAIASVRRVLSSFRARHGVYCTASDADSLVQIRAIFEGLDGVTFGWNAVRTIDLGADGDAPLRLRIGMLSHIYPRPDLVGRGAGSGRGARELFVVGCHSPDMVDLVAARLPDCDLFLCGHTHGGQIQIPGFGPVITLSRRPRHEAAGGVFTHASGMTWALSRGVGGEGGHVPRMRFWCRPHVFLFTLQGPERHDAALDVRTGSVADPDPHRRPEHHTAPVDAARQRQRLRVDAAAE